MMLPRPGDEYPMTGGHAGHVAVIEAVDLHGEPSWADEHVTAPTLGVRCSCGYRFRTPLVEVLAA